MILLSVFIFCLIVFGCSSSEDNRTDLYEIIYDSPDSLLNIVANTDTIGMNKEERYLYNLTYTAAMYRTGTCMDDTTDISACETYYKGIDNDKLYAVSMLYNAENAYNKFEYYKAVEKLMKALDVAKGIGDNALISDIYNLLYRINREAGCSSRAFDYCRKALEYAVKGGHVNQIVGANNDMASVLIAKGDLKKSAEILSSNEEIIDNADKKKQSDYYRIKGECYLLSDSIDAAANMFFKAEDILPTSETFCDIAVYYEKIGDTVKSRNYYYSAITADKRGYVSIKAYNKILENYRKDESFNVLKRICMELNKLYIRRGETVDVSRLEQMEAAYDDEKENGVNIWFIVSFGIIFISGSVYFMIIRKRRFDNDENGDLLFMNENIVYELHRYSSVGKMPTQEQWIALHSAANKYIPFFLSRLHKINDLSAREINICLLTRLHFSPSEIATLTDISPQNVTNIRSRLLRKIFSVSGGAAEFDRRICDMKQ